MTGSVALVGAGPGDPGLLTLRGFELLQEADVVLFDRLVSPEIRALIPSNTVCVDVGKTAGSPLETTGQEDIFEALVAYASAGETVVRLKGGDPFVFGRGFEELERVRAAGIPVEIVPGLSSALAGPANAHIPVTHRQLARGVTITTPARAQAPTDGTPGTPDENAQNDTYCALMPLAKLESISAKLIEEGRSPRMPAVLIERATLPGQRIIRTELDSLHHVASQQRLESPTLLVVGPVAGLQAPGGPLSYRRILITRPRRPARALRASLEARGAEVRWSPLINVRLLNEAAWHCESYQPGCQFAPHYDWIVFTSLHGVHGFFSELTRRGLDARSLASTKIAAVGSKTAAELSRFGVHADLVPSEFRASALANELNAQAGDSRRTLFPRGTLARKELPERLEGFGFRVDTVDVYQTDLVHLPESVDRDIEVGAFDSILLYSPSAVTSLAQTKAAIPRDCILGCVGQTTGSAAAEAFPEAKIVLPATGRYGDEPLLDALEVHWGKSPGSTKRGLLADTRHEDRLPGPARTLRSQNEPSPIEEGKFS